MGKKDQGGVREGRTVCFVYNLSALKVCVFSCGKCLALSLVI